MLTFIGSVKSACATVSLMSIPDAIAHVHASWQERHMSIKALMYIGRARAQFHRAAFASALARRSPCLLRPHMLRAARLLTCWPFSSAARSSSPPLGGRRHSRAICASCTNCAGIRWF